jgi:hypothetical protein
MCIALDYPGLTSGGAASICRSSGAREMRENEFYKHPAPPALGITLTGNDSLAAPGTADSLLRERQSRCSGNGRLAAPGTAVSLLRERQSRCSGNGRLADSGNGRLVDRAHHHSSTCYSDSQILLHLLHYLLNIRRRLYQSGTLFDMNKLIDSHIIDRIDDAARPAHLNRLHLGRVAQTVMNTQIVL